MKGRIRRRSSGHWELTADAGKDANGKRRRRSETFKGSKREADRRLREFVAEVEAELEQERTPSRRRTWTVSEWLYKWLHERVEIQRKLATFERYEGIARKHLVPVIGHIELANLFPLDINDALGKLVKNGEYTRTAELAYTVLSGALNYAWDLEQIDVNPMGRVAMPRAPRRRVDPPHVERVQNLLRLAEDEDHYLFVFLNLDARTGMRRGEMMALRWENVNLKEGYLLVIESAVKTSSEGVRLETPKTERGERRIDLDGRMVELLAEHKERQEAWVDKQPSGCIDKGLVFPGADGDWMKPQNMLRHLKELGTRVDIPDITFHKLRHFHATIALDQGNNPVVVSRRMGHSKVSTTIDLYGHVLPGWQKDVAENVANVIDGEED